MALFALRKVCEHGLSGTQVVSDGWTYDDVEERSSHLDILQQAVRDALKASANAGEKKPAPQGNTGRQAMRNTSGATLWDR